MLCPPVHITQAGGGVLAVAHITCATPSSVKRDSPVLPTRKLVMLIVNQVGIKKEDLVNVQKMY